MSKSLQCKFDSLYDPKKPTGNLCCIVNICNEKRIWQQIKEDMVFGGEGNGEGGNNGDGWLCPLFYDGNETDVFVTKQN